MNQTLDTEALFASFDIEELDILEVSDSASLPQMGASKINIMPDEGIGGLCCSSSSSTCCC